MTRDTVEIPHSVPALEEALARKEAEATMTRDEAVEELGHRYRIRIVVELEHEGVVGAMKGSTMAETAAGVEHALRGLVDVMCPRLLASVEPPPAEAIEAATALASEREGE